MRVIARKIKSAHIGGILVRLTGKTMTIPREVCKKLYNPVETKEKSETFLNGVIHQEGNTLISFRKKG